MSPSSRKLMAQVLTIMLVVLPLTTGLGNYLHGWDSSMAGMQMDNQMCETPAHDADCLQIEGKITHTNSDVECSSDHCDAFSVVTFTTNPSHNLSITKGREQHPEILQQVASPFPNQLLRPPLTLS